MLLSKYEKHARILTSLFLNNFTKKSIGVTEEDLVYVALNSVVLGLQNFNPDFGTPFYSYWKEIASRELIRFVNENSYLAGAKMFSGAISLDELIDKHGDTSVGDILSSKDDDFKEDLYLDDTSFEISEIIKAFPKEEQKALYLYAIGYTYNEICSTLNIPIKKVYAIMRKIRYSVKKKISK